MKNLRIITLIYKTPLSICVQAGRNCWQSHNKGGCYVEPTDDIIDADKDFLKRILKKHKHGSVAEHIRLIFQTDDINLYEYFNNNAFSYTTIHHRDSMYSIATNLRVLLEINDNDMITDELKKYLNTTFIKLLGDKYSFLLKDDESELV